MVDSDHKDAVRDGRIQAILAQEIQDGDTLAHEARRLIGYLLREKKGYGSADIRENHVFEVRLGQESVPSQVDFLVSLNGNDAMIIKCAAGSLDSRHRHAVAAARVMASSPIPVAVVADPTTAHVLDTSTGRVTGEGFGAIPVREQLARILGDAVPSPLPTGRLEKEKRILLAFDAIKCCVPQGADGGVAIGEPPVPGKPSSSAA